MVLALNPKLLVVICLSSRQIDNNNEEDTSGTTLPPIKMKNVVGNVQK